MATTATHAASNALAEVAARAGLDDTAAAMLERYANALKDYFTETVSRPSVPGAASPAMRLAASVRQGDPAAVTKFFEYCRTAHEPATGTAYILVVADREKALRRQLEDELPPDMRAQLDLLPPSLLDIDTGHDPFRAAIEALLAGPEYSVEDSLRHTNKFAGFFCHAPFEFATISHTGDIYVCCPAWLKTPVGNLAAQPWDDVWNSTQAIALRESILDGSYRFCSEAMCPHLSGQTGRLLRNEEVSNPYHREIIDKQLTRLDVNPKDITIQYDRTCNLTCPSCRCDVYKADKEEAQVIQRIHDRVWNDVVNDARRITVAGDGDAFASKLYLKALREFDPSRRPNIRLAFITNGLLLTPAMWQSISNCWPAIESINVSCNAATPETFRINQRGGEFEKLLYNLEHLAAARHRGEFPLLGLGFYIRDNNFREMKEIVRIGKRLGVDRILFGKLTLPSYLLDDLDTFRAMAVHLPTHPQHAELLEILMDPIFLDPIVYLTNLAPLVPGHLPHVGGPPEYRARLSLKEFAAHLRLAPEQFLEVERLVAQFARDYLALMTAPPAPGEPAPADVLTRLLAPGAYPDDEQLAEFESYARGKNAPGGTTTYLRIARANEHTLREKIGALLSAGQRSLFTTLPIESLLLLDEVRLPVVEHARAQLA
jgi:MoaA/NifB/PqqE/SkfB family radical SAM enzyme